MNRFKILLLIVVVSLLSSCATIFTGINDKIYFSVQPENAQIFINGKHCRDGSGEIKVRRSYKKKMVTIKNEGYVDLTFRLDMCFNAVTILNCIGTYGFIVDVCTASVLKYKEAYYDIELTKLPEEKKE